MIKLFGERVAIKELEEKIESEIVMVGKRNFQYNIGEVLATSDKAKEIMKDGDVVLFQSPMDYRTGKILSQVFKHGKDILLVQHSRDMIARLGKSKIVNLENFDPIGEWVLIESRQIENNTGILLPDNIRETPDFFRYYVLKKGSKVAETIQIGDEIVAEPNRLNPIGLDGKNYFYCDQGQICGTVAAVEE